MRQLNGAVVGRMVPHPPQACTISGQCGALTTGDWTFFVRSSGRMPLVPPRARYGRQNFSPGPAKRGAGARDRRPPERGGHSCPHLESGVSSFYSGWLARSVCFVNRLLRPPSPSPSPPTQKTVGGEDRPSRELRPRAAATGTAVPSSCRWRRPGLRSDAPVGGS